MEKYYTVDCGTNQNLRYGNPNGSNSHVAFLVNISAKDLRMMLELLNASNQLPEVCIRGTLNDAEAQRVLDYYNK